MLPFRVRIAAAPLFALLAPGTTTEPAAPEWTVPATPPPAPNSREEYAGRHSKLVEKMGPGVLLVLGADASYDCAQRPGEVRQCPQWTLFYMHGLGHGIGLDVRPRSGVLRRFPGGERVEDDYFITADGVERVSEGAPRQVAEIEALMAQPSDWNRGRRPEVVEWYRGTSPR